MNLIIVCWTIIQPLLMGTDIIFRGLWMAQNLKLYFHGKNNWFYLQDWMFVDYSLEKLFGGFIFDEMQG